jgi:glycosyltransferase involved in cell wall biosynthesis
MHAIQDDYGLRPTASVTPEPRYLGEACLISIVLPLHNEAEAFPKTLKLVTAELERHTTNFEIIAVDDGSTDSTWQVVKELAAGRRSQGIVRAIRFSRNFGKESAISAGLAHASGDAVVVMDADGQHPPRLITKMIDLWRTGQFLVVEAVKQRRQRESLTRSVLARLFYRALIVGAQLDIRNSTDYKLLDRFAVQAYLDLPEHGRFFRGLTTWMGLPTAQLEISPPQRTDGSTSWRLSTLVNFARRTIISFTSLPLRIISWTGFLGFSFSLVLGIQTIWNTVTGSAAAGFPTVILLILALGSLILLSLGLIGEYISEIYNEIKRRPLYMVSEAITSSRPGASHEPPA